jgi:hypothetical protein
MKTSLKNYQEAKQARKIKVSFLEAKMRKYILDYQEGAINYCGLLGAIGNIADQELAKEMARESSKN